MSIVEHRVLGDHRGQLIAIEAVRDIPFEIKRIFYIYGAQPNTPRGQHAHHKTRQYLIAVNGSCHVTLDDGEKQSYLYPKSAKFGTYAGGNDLGNNA